MIKIRKFANGFVLSVAVVSTAILGSSLARASNSCRVVLVEASTTHESIQLDSSRTLQQMSKLVTDYQDYNRREYPLVNFIDRLKRLGPGYEELIVDPGLLQHYDEFARFVQNQVRPLGPWQARDAFARQPSMQTIVYRGLALYSREFEQISRFGMKCNLEQRFGPIKALPLALSGRNDDIQRRQDANYGDSQLLSVTSYPELAAAVANTFVRQKPDSKPVIFEIPISKIDLIHNEHGNGTWARQENLVSEIAITHGGEEKIVPLDSRVESFVLWSIPAAQMKVVEIQKGYGFRFIRD